MDNPTPPIETPAQAAHTLAATYCRPYHMRASLGPSAAVAQLMDGKLTAWTRSQGVYPLRATQAHVLGMPEDDITCLDLRKHLASRKDQDLCPKEFSADWGDAV